MTKIEWTGKTWNPIVGCSIVSPGCTNCYAMKMAARLEAMGDAAVKACKAVPAAHYAGTTKWVNGKPGWTGKVALAPDDILTKPLRTRKPTTWFVNSMGDLFHEDVPDEWIDRVFAVMALCPQHTFQVLTKCSARMQAYMTRGDDEHGDYFERLSDAAVALTSSPCAAHVESVNWPLPNVWIGVSAEDQKRADERIPDLLATPAAVRFVSPPSDAAEARDTAAMIVAIIIKALVRDPVTDDVVLLRLHDLSAHALDQMSRELPSKHQPNPPTKDHA